MQPPRIGAADDDEIGIGACRDRLLDLVNHLLRLDQILLADVMLHTPGQVLIFQLDSREAGSFRHRNGAVHVHRLTPAAARIEHDRDLADGTDIQRDLRHIGETQIRFRDAFEPAK